MDDSILLSHPGPQDIVKLEQLWISTFGDPPELIEAFFEAFPPELHGWIVKRGDELLSSAYLLHGNLLIAKNVLRPAAYVYAVATPEAYRGKGYGGMLMRHFAELASEREFLLYTRPASRSLFHWYADVMQTVPSSIMRPVTVFKEPCSPLLQVARITPEQYAESRERLLQAVEHIALSHAFLQTQSFFSSLEGGGLFSVADGCCTCELQDEILNIKELLIASDMKSAAIQTLLNHFSVSQAKLLVSSDEGEPCVAYRFDEDLSQVNWGMLLD